jgi:hypothetical protein
MMASAKQRPTDVVFFGNLDARVTRSMLHELSVQVSVLRHVLGVQGGCLFAACARLRGPPRYLACSQAGPVARVTLPVVKPGTIEHRGYGFAQYTSLVRLKDVADICKGMTSSLR